MTETPEQGMHVLYISCKLGNSFFLKYNEIPDVVCTTGFSSELSRRPN